MTLSILVAEDNEVVRDVLRELLEQEGYTVAVCETGRAALEHLQSGSVDLVIADLIMPEMDGIELIRRVHLLRPEVKVIAISGDFNSRLHLGAALHDVKATLQKPFSSDELFLTIKSVMADQADPATRTEGTSG
jgi:CheY-like chemotaxis protein